MNETRHRAHSLGVNNSVSPRPTSQSHRLTVLVGRYIRTLRVWASLALRLNTVFHR